MEKEAFWLIAVIKTARMPNPGWFLFSTAMENQSWRELAESCCPRGVDHTAFIISRAGFLSNDFCQKAFTGQSSGIGSGPWAIIVADTFFYDR